MNMEIINRDHPNQLELTFNDRIAFTVQIRPQRKVSRSRWWFEQMRRAVDSALDWQPATPARPVQIWLTEPRRAGG